ncbi:MAG: DNA repair protein RadA [Desulfovibrionaceae bacterium]|nr:DNA repair protein RadA [Desulfovibrionaceae bacterium]
MGVKEIFVCTECGAKSLQWKGQCPGCKEWNTLEARQEAKQGQARKAASGLGALGSAVSKSVSLQNFSQEHEAPYGSGLADLDHILGRGLVPGATILVGGEPGIGKSTLLLQVAGAVAASGRKVLYASGEEGLGQIRDRAERLGVLGPGLDAMATGQLDDVLPELAPGRAPSLLVVDSVQTLASSLADGLPGSVSQVRAVATELIEHCRACGTTLLLVGHVTKDGQLAGPKLLEHMVDTVISLEGDRQFVFRLLRVLKNRFGPNQELIVFEMGRQGMSVVEDPSTFFLGARNPELSGAAVVMAADGQRPFAVEVQALASRSFLSIPRRAAVGFDVNRLHLLLAVLEKRLKLNFGQVDIYAKIGGGLKIQEPGMDLGLVAAVLSSFYDIPLPERAVFWGEVDLNGQIRPVSAHNIRLKQAGRLGYEPVFCPPAGEGQTGVTTIMQLQQRLFRR